MRNLNVILFYCLILLMVGCGAAKKNSETFISQRDSISYALPSSNKITISELCDTLKVKSPVRLYHDNGPIKVRVQADENKLEILTQYDTIFKEKTKEVIKTVTKTEVKYRTNWKWILVALVIGFGIGAFRIWRFF